MVRSELILEPGEPGFAPDDPPAGMTSPCTIEAWIALLHRMLHLPEEESRAVCDELEAHLLERVRDLELSGRSSAEAVEQALSEVGEATGIATRIRSARSRRIRRTLMNISLLGLCGVGLTVGVVSTVVSRGAVPHSVFEPRPEAPPAAVAGSMIQDGGRTLETVIASIGRTVELPVLVDWSALDDHGIDGEFDLGLAVSGLSLETACRLVVDRMAPEIDLAWRFHGDYVELAMRETLDYRERVLLSYDIDGVVEQLWVVHDIDTDSARDQIETLLYEFVEPDGWTANGGNIAHLQVVGGRMFVEAPPRMQEQIAWFLAELSEQDEVGEAGDDAIGIGGGIGGGSGAGFGGPAGHGGTVGGAAGGRFGGSGVGAGASGLRGGGQAGPSGLGSRGSGAGG